MGKYQFHQGNSVRFRRQYNLFGLNRAIRVMKPDDLSDKVSIKIWVNSLYVSLYGDYKLSLGLSFLYF